MAERMDATAWGLPFYLLKSSANLGQALERLFQVVRLFGDLVRLELEVEGDEARLRVRNTTFEPVHLQGAALCLALLCGTLGETGKTHRDMLSAARMQHAAAMLRSTNASLGEIAERIGFNGAGSFSRAFRRFAGVAPGQYRFEQRSHRESA